MRRVSIFGATGSIGQNTIDLIRRDRESYDIVGLSGAGNISQLAADARDLGAKVAVTADETRYAELKDALSGSGVEAAAGANALRDMAARPADWTMSAIVGAAGLLPGLETLKHGNTLALANKESLVTAGPLLMSEAKSNRARVLPVDSEHSAVFQALIGEDMACVERVIITASGGAFRDRPFEDLKSVTVAEAASHPNWDMGTRITIDSASMFNKALELIETKEYFDVSPAKIEAVIHPESLIHAMVGFCDGALMAHVGPPDMRHAIGFALHYPERKSLPVERLDLTKIGQFTFRDADETRYPALRLARDVMSEGGLWGAAFNAAKEQALDAFIDHQIGFLGMAEVVDETLATMAATQDLSGHVSLDNILQTDQLARTRAKEHIKSRPQDAA